MGSKTFGNCEKPARNLRENCEKAISQRADEPPEKPNKIKGFHDFAVTVTRVFQECLRYIMVGVELEFDKENSPLPVMVTGALTNRKIYGIIMLQT